MELLWTQRMRWRHNKNSNLARQEGEISRTTVPQLRGEMPSKLWLIVANFQIHWATLPPKRSVFIAQSGRLRYISSDRKQLYALLKIKQKKHILNQIHHINKRLTNKLTNPGTFIFVTECLTSDIFSMLLCGVSDCIYSYLHTYIHKSICIARITVK